jgi:hypothetical protein
MRAAVELLGAVALEFAAATAFYPALGRPGRVRLAVLAVLWPVIMASPWLVGFEHPFHRFLASVVAVALVAKLYDVHVGAARGFRPGAKDYFLQLPNFGVVVLRRALAEPLPRRGDDLARLAVSALGSVPAVALAVWLFRYDWSRRPFALEHSAKVLAFLLALVAVSTALAAAARLLGLRVPDPMRNPFAAATPADFWTRYNCAAYQFFYEDIFRPAGGLRSPVRAALVTFVVSGLLHEYIFVATLGRVRGLQSAFFLAQGLAVAATLRARPSGWRKPAWRAATYAFMLTSSVLFFECIDDVVPFYSTRAGGAGRSPRTTAAAAEPAADRAAAAEAAARPAAAAAFGAGL